MTSIDEYRDALERAANQEAYLLAHSGLPGPRGNLELARAAAEVCAQPALRRWAQLRPDEAPTGTAEEFLAFCGVLGLGGALVEDDRHALDELRRHASDPRWRLREAVAMALQRWGEVDFEALAAAMDEWARGSPLERRVAAAALCEPALLTTPERVGEVVSVLTEATTGIVQTAAEERRSEEFKALRKGLGYCWSVAWPRRRRWGNRRSNSSWGGRRRVTTATLPGSRAKTSASGGCSGWTLGGSRACSSASSAGHHVA